MIEYPYPPPTPQPQIHMQKSKFSMLQHLEVGPSGGNVIMKVKSL